MRQLYKIIIALLLIAHCPSYADNGYDAEFIDLLEIVYGEGYLSQGGSAIEDKMFEGVNLEGKSILDLGCGIGGPALHLAKNHRASIIGVDPDVLMIQRSIIALDQLRAKIGKSMKGSVQFSVMEDPLTLQEFSDGSFDIVTSRESILHVPNEHKQSYFREIFRILKPGGQLILLDWQHRSPEYSDDLKTMMEMDEISFHLMTPKEYLHTVKQASFSHITNINLSKLFAEETQKDLMVIDAAKSQIIEKFGEETFDYSRSSWGIQGQAFERGELIVALIKAKKKRD